MSFLSIRNVPEKAVTYTNPTNQGVERFDPDGNPLQAVAFDPRDIDKDGMISPSESPPINLQDGNILDIIETQAGSYWRQMTVAEIDKDLARNSRLSETSMGQDKAEYDRQKNILTAAKPWREYYQKVTKANPAMATMGTSLATRGRVDTGTQTRDYMHEK